MTPTQSKAVFLNSVIAGILVLLAVASAIIDSYMARSGTVLGLFPSFASAALLQLSITQIISSYFHAKTKATPNHEG